MSLSCYSSPQEVVFASITNPIVVQQMVIVRPTTIEEEAVVQVAIKEEIVWAAIKEKTRSIIDHSISIADQC